MPHDEGLPQTGDSQEIGQDAYDCLCAKRPRVWHFTDLDGKNDFGFDIQVQISVKQQVVHPFRIQLKGTRSPQRRREFPFYLPLHHDAPLLRQHGRARSAGSMRPQRRSR